MYVELAVTLFGLRHRRFSSTPHAGLNRQRHYHLIGSSINVAISNLNEYRKW